MVELCQRIIQGHRNLDQLLGIIGKLPKSKKQDELGEKYIRMLRSLHDLEDGFIELNPNDCLFELEKSCRSGNKGTFVCGDCPSYLNTVFGGESRLL